MKRITLQGRELTRDKIRAAVAKAIRLDYENIAWVKIESRTGIVHESYLYEDDVLGSHLIMHRYDPGDEDCTEDWPMPFSRIRSMQIKYTPENEIDQIVNHAIYAEDEVWEAMQEI